MVLWLTLNAQPTQLENYSSILHRIVIMSNGDEDMRRSQQGGL